MVKGISYGSGSHCVMTFCVNVTIETWKKDTDVSVPDHLKCIFEKIWAVRHDNFRKKRVNPVVQ